MKCEKCGNKMLPLTWEVYKSCFRNEDGSYVKNAPPCINCTEDKFIECLGRQDGCGLFKQIAKERGWIEEDIETDIETEQEAERKYKAEIESLDVGYIYKEYKKIIAEQAQYEADCGASEAEQEAEEKYKAEMDAFEALEYERYGYGM